MNILNTLNNIMRLLSTDLYIDCDDLIKEANELYQEARHKQMHVADLNYIESMNIYINTYDKFKQRQIKQYIKDLHEYIQTY